MSDNKPPAHANEASVPDNQPQGHPAPPPFNPIPASHTAPNTNHVHSVVPDLMRVYESLTNGNTTTHKGQHPHSPEQKQHQHNETAQDPGNEGPGQSQHINYSYITSEEQYRQLYQHQSGDSASSDQVSKNQHFQGSNAASLPYIPAPYDPSTASRAAVNIQPQAPQESRQATNNLDTDDQSTTSSSRPPTRRKRSITNQQQEKEPAATSSSGGGGKSKSRKKAKETDGRWSKRFTWPDELHRDFVSAVFDVGLKHSSPSTILEHMPKHPQITSERIKSHLQKYRVHRSKSKQEFMSSYEVSLKKFKSGDMDQVKSLTDGEVAAHLSHTVMTDNATGANAGASATGTAQAVSQDGKGQPGPPQSSQLGNPGTIQPQRLGPPPPPPGHEALMLPKLTEAEKSSPIGASMGYLLGLFFSLKKQLLMQRSESKQTSVPGLQPNPSFDLSTGGVPMSAVYSSFAGSNMPPPDAIGNPGAPAPNPPHPPFEIHPVAAAASMDWSSSTNGVPVPVMVAAAPPRGASPVTQSVSTLNNLEASSMMKREMQNQMAFQNKMRALKQQELNKYKHVESNHNNSAPQMETNHHSSVRFKEEEPSAIAAFTTEGNLHHNNQGTKKDHNDMVPAVLPHEESIHHETDHHDHHQAPSMTQMHHHDHDQDDQGDGELKEDERHNNPIAPGDAHGQGAGEAADAARARAPSFSMGANDDFWNADVMDEQLFEFLMNN